MTKQEWDRRPDLRAELTRLLESGVLQDALDVIITTAVESAIPVDPNGNLIHQAALAGASREGFFSFLKKLKALTQEPKARQEEPKPWGHVARKTQVKQHPTE